MAIEDSELIVRALDGSESAYRGLVERYQRPIYSLLLRMVRDAALAEDLAQEVFVKAIRALHTFDRRRQLSSWLFKIAHNTAIDHLRRNEPPTVPLESPDPERPGPLDLIASSTQETPESRASRRDLAAAIVGAVEALRPEYREVVVLRFEQGLAYEEIAEVTGLPLGTVKTHIFRARKLLVRQLESEGWRPGESR